MQPTPEDQIQALQEQIDNLRDGLLTIHNWCKAYPIERFPEPDFSKCAAALRKEGLSLDQVSASNMRHVLQGIEEIVNDALKSLYETGNPKIAKQNKK